MNIRTSEAGSLQIPLEMQNGDFLGVLKPARSHSLLPDWS
jgi:hypothetical protein